MTDQPLTHSQLFTDQILPQLFHGAPAQLWKYLEQDGTKFLNFYWDNAGQNLPSNQRERPFGLNFVFKEPFPRTNAVVITLPAPKIDGESYFTGLVYRPDRRILLVSDMTRVFNLEKVTAADGNPATRLVQWTTHLERVEFPDPVEPQVNPFLDAVLLHLDD
jgi:hypothetical protein